MSATNRILKVFSRAVPAAAACLVGLALGLAPLTLAQGLTDKTKPAKEYVRLNGRVIAIRVCPSCPTVKLTDNSHSGTTHYRVGDSFTVTVKGPASQAVAVNQNGGGFVTVGNTDASGNWSTSGTWGSGNAGSYTQIWTVGGVPAMPELIFTVYTS